MSGLSKTISAGVLLGLFSLAGCSRLPAYSQPRIETSAVAPAAQTISYRQLAVADFRATALPEDLKNHGQDLNAHSSVAIRTRPGANYVLPSLGDEGRKLLCGHAENLGFEAVMFPEKSWWRPTLAKDKELYVLQHEQIHFALMEVAARQLNRKITKEDDQLTTCEADAEAIVVRISATIDRWLAESRKETLRQHVEFEEDTSRLFAPKMQQWWYDRAMKELLNLTEWQ